MRNFDKFDIDLEETDVQEILPPYKESRQLRGEHRGDRGYRPVTGQLVGGNRTRLRADSTSKS